MTSARVHVNKVGRRGVRTHSNSQAVNLSAGEVVHYELAQTSGDRTASMQSRSKARFAELLGVTIVRIPDL